MANITIVSWRDYAHPEAGGSTVYITKIAEHLAKKGHNVTFLGARIKGEVSHETHNSVSYVRIGGMMSEFLYLPLYYFLFLGRTTDLVIESYDAWPFLIPLWHEKSITLIHHLQEEEWIMYFGPFFGPILKTIARFLLRLCYKSSNIVTVSPSTSNLVVAEGIHMHSLTEIYAGIPDLLFRDVVNKRPTDCINLVSLTRLKEHKRVDLAIKLLAYHYTTIKKQKKKMVPVNLHILGNGDQEENLKALATKLKITDHVIFHGFVTENEKRAILAQSHLSLQLSKREGWGITVIEAASQGVPTLCLDVPGLRDSVTPDTGYVVPNLQELPFAFEQIVTDIAEKAQSYKTKVKKAKAWSQAFRWSRAFSRWDALISSVLGKE